ncbi:hypothetical protein H5410_026328 [Solanum commersonii]|uniref:Uncharacterized protein n=1 Tax=Solanum commersonii TaxID=4109 RepID=A0A9J5Z0F0_SOLCO|nr:hypothetical protein H5410_026328 [Solanum commersonii]
MIHVPSHLIDYEIEMNSRRFKQPKGNGDDTNVHVNQQLSLLLLPSPFSSDRMLTLPSLVHCPLCESVYGYQKFMNHLLSHPINYQMEKNVVEYSNSKDVHTNQ